MKRQPDSFRRDIICELILKLRRTQPADYEVLQPDTKLMALDYEARKREWELLHATETKAA